MSIKLINIAWRVPLTSAYERVALVALADYADDDGTNCFPSIPRLMAKTTTTRPTLYRALKVLTDLRLITRKGDDYTLDVERMTISAEATRPASDTTKKRHRRTIATSAESHIETTLSPIETNVSPYETKLSPIETPYSNDDSVNDSTKESTKESICGDVLTHAKTEGIIGDLFGEREESPIKTENIPKTEVGADIIELIPGTADIAGINGKAHKTSRPSASSKKKRTPRKPCDPMIRANFAALARRYPVQEAIERAFGVYCATLRGYTNKQGVFIKATHEEIAEGVDRLLDHLQRNPDKWPRLFVSWLLECGWKDVLTDRQSSDRGSRDFMTQVLSGGMAAMRRQMDNGNG
jgi:Helix-turn-helix domain